MFMNKPIIEVKNLSKEYLLSHRANYETFRDTVTDLAKLSFRLFNGKGKMEKEKFLALQGVNFEIHKGEAIGLIGANGSGKSTLLKILSQITPPTTGEIILHGNVASLLEIGTGFHPELTGRENVFLNGAILGMSKKEIARKFDEIVRFSGVEKFLDTPVKRYSSGMLVRLAFSVAAHMEPDILIVDEVLAVGDADFQKKSMGKMDQVTKEAGRTIIFVSHNMDIIRKICTRCILLKNGKLIMFDKTDKVVEKYLNKNGFSGVSLANRRDGSGKEGVKFTEIKITNLQNSKEIKSGDKLRIALKYESEFKEKIGDVRVVITIVNENRQPVLRLDSDVCSETFNFILNPKGEVICETGEAHLTEGRYFADIDFLIKGTSRDNVLMAGEFDIRADLDKYDYKTMPDKTICNYLIKYNFKQ